MRLRILILLFVFINISIISSVFAGNDFRLIDKWSYEEIFYGKFFGAVVTNDDDLILMFHRINIQVANKDKHYVFAHAGQGPNEVGSFTALCLYKNRVAEIESNRKIQIFKKADGKYNWEKNIWREEKGVSQSVSSAVFTNGKWFFAGQEEDFRVKQKGAVYHLLRICEEDGTFIKRLFRREYKEPRRIYLMSFYVKSSDKNVFFIAEDQPIVHVISKETLTITKEVKLEMPDFYVPLPDDFYIKRIRKNSDFFTIQEFLQAIQRWKSSYSRITNVIIEDNKLVIQIRTCSEKLQRFALLFYDLPTFKFDKMIYTNDFLLTSKSGKYYFFENGNPGVDDEAEDFVINIYTFKEGD